jgi:hypothetical protein
MKKGYWEGGEVGGGEKADLWVTGKWLVINMVNHGFEISCQQ